MGGRHAAITQGDFWGERKKETIQRKGGTAKRDRKGQTPKGDACRRCRSRISDVLGIASPAVVTGAATRVAGGGIGERLRREIGRGSRTPSFPVKSLCETCVVAVCRPRGRPHSKTFMPPRGRPTLVVLPPAASSSCLVALRSSFCDDTAACRSLALAATPAPLGATPPCARHILAPRVYQALLAQGPLF